MKHLIKNISILIFSLFFVFLTIESSNAEDKIKLVEIKATSNKTVELKLDKEIKDKEELKSDLEIYRSINNTPKKDDNDSKKIILDLKSALEANTSYSLISISGVEGNILFKTGDDILGKEIQNNDLVGEDQGIKSILIKNNTTLELSFLENIDSNDLEFQLYKTIEVDKIKKSYTSSNIKVLLKKEIQDNSEYLGTLTYFETSNLEKIQIEKGIYYFSTKQLKVYDPSVEKEFAEEEEKVEEDENEKTLEDTLMNALDNNTSSGELLDGEKEIKEELESAKEDPENNEKTQLEEMALKQKQTPDSGAETWVLLFATFILNTLYFLSRRKKSLK